MTHAQGQYLYRARIGVQVHASRCGGTDSLHRPLVTDAARVTCARCIRVLLPRG